MSKKILLLYFTQEEKKEAEDCIGVFKATMRKFRKSLSFTFMQIYTDRGCTDAMKKLYEKEVLRHDAAILCTSYRSRTDEHIFFKEIAGVTVNEYFSAGKVICTPASEFIVENNEKSIIEKSVSYPENIQRAAEAAALRAQKRKHSLMICTGQDSDEDRLLFTECEYSISKDMHIQAEHTTVESLILSLGSTLPSADVILSTELWAKIILMHFKLYSKLKEEFSVRHTGNKKVYCVRMSADLKMSSCDKISLLLAFSAVLEEEFTMKNAADWLRRCVASVSEKGDFPSQDEFLSGVISAINTPIYHRKSI